MRKLVRTAIIDSAALDDVVPDSWEDEPDEAVPASSNEATQPSLKECREKSTIEAAPVAKVAILRNEQPRPFAQRQAHGGAGAKETVSVEERMKRYQEARDRIFKKDTSAGNAGKSPNK